MDESRSTAADAMNAGGAPRQRLSRAEILRAGRASCAAQSLSLTGPDRAVEFDVPAEELEFAVALWHFCSECLDALWKETDLGSAFQYGPDVLLSRDSGRFALEKYETTAAARRRFHRIRCDELAQARTGLLVVDELEARNWQGKKFVLEPGELIRRGGRGTIGAFSASGWVEGVRLSEEQLAALRTVSLVERDFTYHFVDAADAALFEELTGAKFLKYH